MHSCMEVNCTGSASGTYFRSNRTALARWHNCWIKPSRLAARFAVVPGGRFPPMQNRRRPSADRHDRPLSGVGNCLLNASIIRAAGLPGGRSARPLSLRRGELELAAIPEEIRCLCPIDCTIDSALGRSFNRPTASPQTTATVSRSFLRACSTVRAAIMLVCVLPVVVGRFLPDGDRR